MNKKTSTEALVQSSLLTALTIVIVLVSVYVPFVSVVGVFLWPIPVTLIYVKHGFKYSFISTIVTAIIVFMFLGPVRALVFIGGYGLLGIVVGYCISSKKPVVTTLLLMAGTTLLTTVISLKLFTLINGQDIIKESMNQFAQSANMVKDIYIKAGMPKNQVDSLLKVDALLQLVNTAVPALLFMASVITSIINYLFTYVILKKLGYKIEGIPPLGKWYIPSLVQRVLIVLMLLMYILSVLNTPNTSNYLVNLFIIFMMVFLVNGFASLDFLLIERGVTRGVRIALLIFIAITPLLNIIFFVGVFDYIFDTRKLDSSRRRTTR